LPVYACGPLVRFDLLPSRLQGAWAIHFVDQTKPFTCLLTPLPSAANIRSVQTARSTHTHSVGAVSVCLAFSDTGTDSLMRSHFLNFAHPLIRTPFPHAAFLLRTFQAAVCHCLGTRGEPRLSRLSSAHRFQCVFGPVWLLQPIGTTMALTPAARHLGLQVSPFISLRIPDVPPPTTRVARMSFSSSPLNAYDVFQTSPSPS